MRAPSLAVVGSGPAAFYTILRATQRLPELRIDMFERQCVPFGLTRFGVAPDHPEVKNCQERFTEVAQTANFRFFGNCEAGRDIELPRLAARYDAVLLAYGAQSERHLSLPSVAPESSMAHAQGVFSARHFVGWYNGEPEFRSLPIGEQLASARKAVIIGNGNVALDVARILLREPDKLHPTDISSEALLSLRQSAVSHVDIVARRGLLHAAFTNKELRELEREPNTRMLPPEPRSELALKSSARATKRKIDLLNSALSESNHEPKTSAAKTWRLSFLRSPQRFVYGQDGGLRGVEWVLNRYREDSQSTAVAPTDETAFEPADLVFTSIGYRALPLPGLDELGAEFDSKRGVLARSRGRINSESNVFAAGWVATGPVGVIASTMMDSFAVGEELAMYLDSNPSNRGETIDSNELGRTVSWNDWVRLNEEELRRGKELGRCREKFLSSADMLAWLDKS